MYYLYFYYLCSLLYVNVEFYIKCTDFLTKFNFDFLNFFTTIILNNI